MNDIFIYGVVANRTSILAEFSCLDENFHKMAVKILECLNPSIPNAMLEQENYIFQTITDQDYTTFLCLSDKRANAHMRVNVLEEMRSKWRQIFGNNLQKCSATTQNFSFIIHDILSRYNLKREHKHNQEKDNTQLFQDQPKDIKTTLQTEAFVKSDNMKESPKRDLNKFRMVSWQRRKLRIGFYKYI